MCLILFAYDIHPVFKLVLAANRDEFYDRPANALSYWDDLPQVLAGRDLRGMGTWLGLSTKGKIAAISNYRDPASVILNAPTRGMLVADYLSGNDSPETYLAAVQKNAAKYSGFNLLLGTFEILYYYSNRENMIRRLAPGLYGLSNHLLDTPWPKVEKGKASLADAISPQREFNVESIFNLLQDRSHPPDDLLPDTGVGLEKEKMLSPVFIESPTYGTRCSSVILMERSGRCLFTERTFKLQDEKPASRRTVEYFIE